MPAEIERVFNAAGGAAWPAVKRVRFTFNVEDGGELKVSAKHDWDVAGGTDVVTVAGNSTMIRLADSPTTSEEKEAFKRWTNDAYWLLMPLKLKDPGVAFGPVMTTRDMPASRAKVTMRFAGVGLTPGDQYDLSIDLKTDRVTHWVYRPNAEKKLGFTWDDYKTFGPLTLATEHKSDDGKRRIFFTDVTVE